MVELEAGDGLCALIGTHESNRLTASRD